MHQKFKTSVLIAMSAVVCFSQTVKFASLAPSGSPYDNGLREIAAKWEQISNGKVKMRIYPGGIAGDEDDIIRKLKIGQLHAAGITGIGLCRLVKDILAIQLPMLVRTNEELKYVMEKMAPEFQVELEKKGVRVMAWLPVGWGHYFAKNPVGVPDQLKKMKMFVWNGDTEGVLAWKELGYRPVSLAATDIFSSLQSGMIEALATPPLSAASYQWFTVANNMCSLKWAPLIGGIVISTSTWKKLSPELRPKLEAAVRTQIALMSDEILAADREAIEAMKKNGLTVNEVSQEMEKKWQKLADEGLAKLEGKSFSARYRKLVEQHVATYRASRK
jgi:TRAP-type C4-dicarboxylate transport system substrate-binding protein